MSKEGKEGKKSGDIEQGDWEATSDQTSVDLAGCGWIVSFSKTSHAEN